MNRKLKKELKLETFLKLREIFNKKDWEIEDDDSNEMSLFNRFSSLLSELSLEEQNLTLELTERFTKIDFDDYMTHIKKAIAKFISEGSIDMTKITRIHIAPLISPEDFGKSKSSTMVHYLFKGSIRYINHIGNKKLYYTDDLNIDYNQINKEGNILIVVDDFIGTGETACSAIDYLIDEKNVIKEKIVVISIASLEQGIQLLSEKGIYHYSSVVFNKGITDYCSTKEELDYKLEIMDSIETKIKAHKNERLGYNKSEALITLIRTPNNTFPLFWKEKGARVAPFPRN
ncbi:phosphoribosyltransferase [Sporosarcina limicola]|uniref:Hypoxanthine phosphoribosyltransferase n=1 Tax=Sporosarcina limicola TaxID=34101 RepID=A0A927MKZ0_9BACL|nr:phosphoribosyltransferase [Sporosarcina limicola]MBE1556285.1 hypoxanthine phosphoribosyltransferase [Sporosarcina limicola]